MDNHYFLGLPVPREARSVWGDWISQVKNELPFKQWVPPQDFHITLHFFGRLSPEQVNVIEKKMKEVKLTLYIHMVVILNSGQVKVHQKVVGHQHQWIDKHVMFLFIMIQTIKKQHTYTSNKKK